MYSIILSSDLPFEQQDRRVCTCIRDTLPQKYYWQSTLILFSSYPQMTIDLFKQVIFISHLYLYIKSHIYMDPEVETYL